jgi:uncharacterized protein YecT (DUF1311 family)
MASRAAHSPAQFFRPASATRPPRPLAKIGAKVGAKTGTRTGAAVTVLGALILGEIFLGAVTQPCRAQADKPTARQIAAVRACTEKNRNDIVEAERACLFTLVADPCQKTPEGRSNLGMADCFRLEQTIWDDLLNENYKRLAADSDARAAASLRTMQRAWIADRDATCGFYDARIHGSMAIPLAAACLARETARRALLLRFFGGL